MKTGALSPLWAGDLVDQAGEYFRREIGPMADRDHIVKFCELTFDLLKFWFVRHVQEDTTGCPVRKRHDDDGFEVEGAPGEEPGDVRHGAGMVAHAQLEDRGGGTR